MLRYWLQNRKGDLEMDQLGKLIIGAIVLIILIYIVTVVIKGEFDDQGGNVENIFSSLGD